MGKNILVRVGLAIFIMGLAVALPELSSELFFDFSTLSDNIITVLRIGLTAISIGVVFSK